MPRHRAIYCENGPLVIAHRGARDVAPENTLAAFRAAIETGADGIELDVTRCASGEIVVIHDDTVDRTTNGSGRVDQLPLRALHELDAGSWFDARFAGEHIPTLEEALDVAGCQLVVNIEIKGMRLHGDGLEDQVAAMVRARALEERVIVSSFNPSALWRMRRAAPEIERGLLYAPDLPLFLSHAWARSLVAAGALHPEYHMVDEAMVRQAHQRGLRVNAWTVNEAEAMERMVQLGVDGIITDHPAALRLLVPR
ncbi:MAG: glycerophosphodiester phosphodiesterase [Anaerolineae bacterium]